jgi:hypothetical protein
MPVDLTDPQGFNKFWEETVGQFRAEAIDNHLDGGNLDPLNSHVTGAVDADTLAAQYDFPVVWSIPTNHSPNYATITTDQGALTINVVVFAADTDPDAAFQKARVLGGRIVNNVEGSALVDDNGDAHAGRVDLNDFQTDSRPVAGQGAQVKFAELSFAVQVERDY